MHCYYWIEIARCPSLADEHPRWMASVQGHDEWRRLFENPPRPDESQVVKVHPWVPVLYEESFAAHLDRVRAVISNLPPAEGILLNDLQGPPSACGCGNPQCRWTADYGPRRTATPKDDFAARDFLVEVRKLTDKQVIPIWVTECEQHDEAADGWCAGVGCFRGICWKAYTKQLMPVAEGDSADRCVVAAGRFPAQYERRRSTGRLDQSGHRFVPGHAASQRWRPSNRS